MSEQSVVALDARLSPVKQALKEIRRLKQELAARARPPEPIAIVGMGVRFPGGIDTPEAFWEVLHAGRDAVGPMPRDRWDHDRYYDPDPSAAGKYYVRHGGFLRAVDGFDPEFFGIAPLEAETMDPQQRLLLEVGWEALEHAGIAASALRGTRSGVFVGIANDDYARLVLREGSELGPYASTGATFSVAAGRIAYVLGLQGPALAIDTACSSSLAAVHLAVASLRNGESELALAGGVNLILAPEQTVTFCRAGMLATDGRCKTFDAAADGYVRSEGCGLVVLERLGDAVRAGHRVLALVRGSAINHDGRSAGLTAPNGPAQEAVLRAALAAAGLGPDDVAYVEAHGTGTALGDPIEAQALGAAFRERASEQPLLIGSVKTNLGHTEGAAGIAGLIKCVLALQHGEIPPSLHFRAPSPHIPWDRLPLRVPVEATPFGDGGRPRRAGVSSFGFSGTNVHVVLEEAPAQPPTPHAPGPRDGHLLTLSAPDPERLRAVARALVGELARTSAELRDIAHTLGAGRTHFPNRLALVASDVRGARRKLEGWLEGDTVPGLLEGLARAQDAPAVAFVLGGDAPLSVEALANLAGGSPVVREAVAACEASARHLGGGVEGTATGAGVTGAVGRLTALLALARLWQSWGIRPQLLLGSGVGALAAAELAGCFSLDDALRLAAAFDGPPPGILELLRSLSPGAPRTARLLLAGTGAVPTGRALGAGEWARALAAAPLAAAVDQAREEGARWFVELGGSGVEAGAEEVWARAGAPEAAAWSGLLHGLARLYVAGAAPDWPGVELGLGAARISLPTYPFRRRRFWIPDPAPAAAAEPGNAGGGRGAAGQRAAASPDAPWQAAVSAAAERARLAPLDVNVASYPAKWAALEELTVGLERNVLTELGAFAGPGRVRDAAAVLQATGIRPIYGRIVERALAALARQGVLRRVANGFVAEAAPEPVDLAPIWDRAAALLADNEPLLALLRHASPLLADVLTGRASPLEILFPGGSFDLAARLYDSSAQLRYVNGIAAAALRAYAGSLAPDAVVRVLELGAGTGGTTGSLLTALPPGRARYDYTDLSEIFLDFGRERFREHADILKTRLFDLERPPEAQGVAPRSYEVVIASNVVHAVRDIRAALANIRTLLAPGGLLLLVESTGHLAWHDISVGLIEGWQRFEDDLRAEDPLLSAGTWLKVLRDAGFAACEAWPDGESPAGVLLQHVLAAREPGMTAPGVRDGARAAERAAPAPAAAPTVASTPAAAMVAATAAATVAATPVAAPPGPAVPAAAAGSLARRVRTAVGAEKEELVTAAVREGIIHVLRWDSSRPPDRDARLMELGVDSLVAVRIRNELQRRLGLEKSLPSTLVFDYPTIRQIVRLVLARLDSTGPAGAARAAAGGVSAAGRAQAAAGREAEVAALSEEEAEARLLARLEGENRP